tara:strand:- start:293 stop:634 length:342 start_codon:yes stop_codon:yes gene_type:complete
MREKRVRRMSPGVGYTGFGNKTFTYTGSSVTPFSKIKQIYGDELERLRTDEKTGNLSFEKLTLQQKTEIKKKIIKELTRTRIQQLVLLIVSGFVLSGVLYFFLLWFFLVKQDL